MRRGVPDWRGASRGGRGVSRGVISAAPLGGGGAGLAGGFETGAEVFERDDLGGAFGEERELVFDGGESLHAGLSIKTVSCQTGALTPGGRHSVESGALRGAPVGRRRSC